MSPRHNRHDPITGRFVKAEPKVAINKVAINLAGDAEQFLAAIRRAQESFHAARVPDRVLFERCERDHAAPVPIRMWLVALLGLVTGWLVAAVCLAQAAGR